MRKNALVVFFAVTVVVIAAVVVLDLSGVWELNFQGTLEGEELPCVFKGSITVLEAFQGGSSTVALQSGPDACPDQLQAEILSITVDGSSVSGTLDGGEMFGMVDFQGTAVSPKNSLSPKGAQQAPQNLSVSGTYTVRGGPFDGTEGSWNAERQRALSDIPLLSPAGIVGLGLFLLLAALYLQRRKGLLTR